MNSFVKWLDERTYQRRTIIWCKFIYAKALWKNGFKKKTILFYPNKPRMWSIVYPICHVLGYKITNDPTAKFDIAMAFEAETVRTPNKTLDMLAQKYHVLNSKCDDISKAHVDKIFLESFGYGLTIDPRTYKGRYIKKTNENGVHFVEIHDKPEEPEEGFVYQRIIDQTDGDSATDIRTFIFGEDIPFTLYRKHDIRDRFGDDTIIATRVDTDTAFSKDEQAAIIRFCKTFGLDYGELDILRDKNDGRIYIVDVNNTPSGPLPDIHMSKADYDRFLGELTVLFKKMAEENMAANSNQTPTV